MLPVITESRRRATRREDLITMVLAGWTIVGLFVDAYYHSTDPSLESFWTPWHAIFYSGFLATAAWLTTVLFRYRSAQGLFDEVPLGYRAALVGIGLFAVGGAGDAVWHEVLGVETSLDALLSPTHILLWLGLLAITSTPLRAAWRDPDGSDDATVRSFLPVLASLTIVVALVAFFFEYAWVLADDGFPRSLYDATTDEGQVIAAYGVMGIIVTTGILMTPLLLASRRWTLPFGTATTVFVLTNFLITIGFDEDAVGMIPALAAGLVFDSLVRLDAHRYLLSAAPAVVLWLGYMISAARVGPIAWPPEIWGGATFFAALAALSVTVGADLIDRAPARSRRLRSTNQL